MDINVCSNVCSVSVLLHHLNECWVKQEDKETLCFIISRCLNVPANRGAEIIVSVILTCCGKTSANAGGHGSGGIPGVGGTVPKNTTTYHISIQHISEDQWPEELWITSILSTSFSTSILLDN